MKSNTVVTPKVGFYVVTIVDRTLGVQMRFVGKDKRCSCGGTAQRPCRHIRAVTDYLRQGGKRAPEAGEESATLRLREKSDGGPPSGTPMTCPLCGATVEKLAPDFWRCPKDPSHYWQWRGERDGGAIKHFLTQRSHPAKKGPFYDMSLEERESFLEQASRRFNAGGYTAHN
jgi:hypothetical protein